MARRAKKPKARGGRKPTRTLRRFNEAFEERRFEPAATQSAYFWVIVMSVGSIAMGSAFYALFVRDAELEPIPYMPYLLVVGAALVLAYLVFSQQGAATLRVGELGVGNEKGDKITRTAWWQIQAVAFEHGVLTLKTTGAPIHIDLKEQRAAAALILAEAAKRIPDRVEVDESDAAKIGTAGKDGERVTVDPPQVAGERCRTTEEPLTFEKDVRMCSRCSVLYHRNGVPKNCAECGRSLKN